MKASLLFLLVALRSACGTATPQLQWDPATAADCVEWYNNSAGESCEYVRDYFGITAEEFHAWNPSVGLDCQPWEWQSYCIVTLSRLNNTTPSTSSSASSSTTARTSTSSTATTPGPSPTSWAERGCYVEDPSLPILEERVSPAGGDAALTVPACENACYLRAYVFAGVQDGNQCWCSSYVAGNWADNQTDCNTPCAGDNETFCGGRGLVNVFGAEENTASTTATATATAAEISGTATEAGSPVGETQSSGAMRNLGVFGRIRGLA
ncbi:hypothetical protein F4810DRAFT_102462 [Camillea tinctor]|nr:hypothetical protein F4810DRAFT_102462 [Camillea tinctor]